MKTQLRNVKVPLVFLLCGLLIGSITTGVILRAITPSTPQYLSSGATGDYSYLLSREGSIYFARNASGAIDYSGTNASQVINNALGTGDVTVVVKIAEYVLTAPVLIQFSNTWLIGENRESVEFTTSADIDLIRIISPSSAFLENIKVANIWLNGKGAGATRNGLYAEGRIYYSDFEHITATHNNNGLLFNSTSATRGYRSRFQYIHAKYNLLAGLSFIEQDAHTLYKVDSHENTYGIVLQQNVQGFNLDACRFDMNSDGIYVVGVQGLRITTAWLSENANYGLFIGGGCNDIVFDTSYIEASGETQIYITNAIPWSNYDIRITNNRIVRGEKQGISISGDNGKNTSNVRMTGNTIINNGQALNDTYHGIEVYGSGSQATEYVYIQNNYIGNDDLEVGSITQRGIKSVGDSNYFEVMGNDVVTSLYTNAITEQIVLAGANNIQEHNIGDE